MNMTTHFRLRLWEKTGGSSPPFPLTSARRDSQAKGHVYYPSLFILR